MKNEQLVERIALARIRTLLAYAEERTAERSRLDRKLARRYVDLARRISTHYKVGIPKGLKWRICRNCGNFMVPGANCSVRLASSHGYVVYVCECGEERHVFYKKAR